jgi:DNA-binding MarR family transcriptional regulator
MQRMENELIASTWRAIHKILRTAETGERKLADSTGLTSSQVQVMQEIARCGDVTPSEVAHALQLSQASITNIVDRLEELQLATRRRGEKDKRQVRLTLTVRGAAMLESATDLLQNRVGQRFDELASWEQAMILTALERLADLLDTGGVDGLHAIRHGAADRAVH